MYQTADQSVIQIVTLVVALSAAAAYLFLTARPPSILRSCIKTLSVAALALAAWNAGAPALLVVALGSCALGDFCLSRDGDTAFMAGVGAFAVGHLIYVALFLGHPLADLSRLIAPTGGAFCIVLVLVGGAMARLLAPRAGSLAMAVLAYIPIILSMAVAAMTLPVQGALVWVLPAAISFMVSDMVLAVETFVLSDDHALRRYTPYAIWSLYWGAQVGFFAAFA